MKNRSHKYDINKIRSRHGYEYGPVQKRMTFLYFLHLLLKMSYFEINIAATIKKKYYTSKID